MRSSASLSLLIPRGIKLETIANSTSLYDNKTLLIKRGGNYTANSFGTKLSSVHSYEQQEPSKL